MAELIINADGAIVGRLGAHAAKQALLGNKISIINSEKAVFTGRKEFLVEKYHHIRKKRGTPFKGPFISRLADRFLRRTIRGMLPYKQSRGRDAYKNIMCYLGVPEEFKNKEATTVDKTHKKNSHSMIFTSVGELCKALGGKQ